MTSKATLFEKIKKKIKPKSKTRCAKTPGNLAVYVLRTDTQDPVHNATVTARGPSPGNGPTDGEGWIIFRDRAPGVYQAEVSLPPMLSKFHLRQGIQSGAIAPDGTEVLEFEASPPPVLKVKVISRRPKGDKVVEEVVSDVEIEARGPAQYSANSAQDWSTFRDVSPGTYRVAVKSLGARAPNYLMPEVANATLALGETKEVILVAPPLASLRIILFDRENVPIQSASWELESPRAESGSTKLDGLIKIENIPLSRGAGKLKVRYPKPKVPLKPPPAALPPQDPNKAPPYPPKIDHAQFSDKDPAPASADADPSLVEWTLKLGVQEDYADDAGVKARLGNLGFRCNSASDGAATTSAVKAYQRKHLNQRDGTGALADVKGDVMGRHDNA